MSEIPWYPFFTGDYQQKTAHLSMLEHGAYRLLIDHYYSTRNPLPKDPVKLFRICRARSPSERKAVVSVIAEFFTEDGTLMRSKRCDSEIDKLLNYSNRQSAAAQRRHSHGNATAMPRARVPHSHPQSEKKAKKEESAFALPPWLPLEEWEAFKEMRKRIGQPLSSYAEKLAIGKLGRYLHDGHDIVAILNSSTLNNWKDLYPPKPQKGNAYDNRQSKLDLAAAAVAEARAERERGEQAQAG